MTQNISETIQPGPTGSGSLTWQRVYDVCVGGWLSLRLLRGVLTGRLDRDVTPKSLIKGAVQRRARGTLDDIQHESGHCYRATAPDFLISDLDGVSTLALLEDGESIGPAHAAHAEIRGDGLGRHSHWGVYVFFSSTDNSDPRTNGRLYTFRG